MESATIVGSMKREALQFIGERFTEVTQDLRITLEQLRLELNKTHPNKDVVDKLLHHAVCKAVAVEGTLRNNGF